MEFSFARHTLLLIVSTMMPVESVCGAGSSSPLPPFLNDVGSEAVSPVSFGDHVSSASSLSNAVPPHGLRENINKVVSPTVALVGAWCTSGVEKVRARWCSAAGILSFSYAEQQGTPQHPAAGSAFLQGQDEESNALQILRKELAQVRQEMATQREQVKVLEDNQKAHARALHILHGKQTALCDFVAGDGAGRENDGDSDSSSGSIFVESYEHNLSSLEQRFSQAPSVSGRSASSDVSLWTIIRKQQREIEVLRAQIAVALGTHSGEEHPVSAGRCTSSPANGRANDEIRELLEGEGKMRHQDYGERRTVIMVPRAHRITEEC